MDGFNADLRAQMGQLEKILLSNEILSDALGKADALGFSNYYFGAGCITQSVWNYQMGLESAYGISDMDFAYYDGSDLSFETENSVIERIAEALKGCPIRLDIKNQARVHLWYKGHFGYDVKPYKFLEEAINSWPTTATSIGARMENGKIKVYAPFGLNDLFGMIVRANKTRITEDIYMEKVNKWLARWPKLTVIPW